MPDDGLGGKTIWRVEDMKLVEVSFGLMNKHNLFFVLPSFYLQISIANFMYLLSCCCFQQWYLNQTSDP